jgi:hypothetical protein
MTKRWLVESGEMYVIVEAETVSAAFRTALDAAEGASLGLLTSFTPIHEVEAGGEAIWANTEAELKRLGGWADRR